MTSIVLDNGQLTTLSGIAFPAGVRFVSARANMLTDLVGLPPTVEIVDVSDNKTLVSLNGISSVCKQVIANNCGLQSVTGVPSGLLIAELNYNSIADAAPFASCTNLTHLQIDYNKLTNMAGIPISCKFLSIEANTLNTLANCPQNVVNLSIRNNVAIANSHMASLPSSGSLKSLDIYGTSVTDYSLIPASVKDLIINPGTSLTTVDIDHVSQVRTVGGLNKRADNASIKKTNSGGDVAVTSSNQSFSFALPFYIGGGGGGLQIYQNDWTQLAPDILYSADCQGSANPVLHIAVSLKVVASFEIRIVISDVTPYDTLLDTTNITVSTLTTHLFTLSRRPTSNCSIELQGRLGSGVSGKANAKYATVYAAVMYF